VHSPDYINIVFHFDSKTKFVSRYNFEKPILNFYGNDFNKSFSVGELPDEYSTLNKKEYSQLLIQNHKITSATLRIDEITNVYQFEMISKYDPSYPIDHKKMIEFFNLSIESMTFVSRRVGYTPKKRYESSTGICWKVAGSTK